MNPTSGILKTDKMKYSLKYTLLRLWWRLFAQWKYDAARKVEKAFDKIREDKMIWRACTKNIKSGKP